MLNSPNCLHQMVCAVYKLMNTCTVYISVLAREFCLNSVVPVGWYKLAVCCVVGHNVTLPPAAIPRQSMAEVQKFVL